jgi:RNA polymerase sigma factor (sigma-70 family)
VGEELDAALVRELVPQVIGVLVRRGAEFAAAEDAVQDALLAALATWPRDPPRDPEAWLVTAAWRRFLDATRSHAARTARELRMDAEPVAGVVTDRDDPLELYLRCAHPSLTPASAVALPLRAVGGLTTRQIAEAYLVPEATMAQRISRAKRTVSRVSLDEPGSLVTVLRVLYLVFDAGYSGDLDLSCEAIRLARQLHAVTDHEEAAGLLALMLLHHIGLHTPADVHTGRHHQVRAARQAVLDHAYLTRPERFPRPPPSPHHPRHHLDQPTHRHRTRDVSHRSPWPSPVGASHGSDVLVLGSAKPEFIDMDGIVPETDAKPACRVAGNISSSSRRLHPPATSSGLARRGHRCHAPLGFAPPTPPPTGHPSPRDLAGWAQNLRQL